MDAAATKLKTTRARNEKLHDDMDQEFLSMNFSNVSWISKPVFDNSEVVLRQLASRDAAATSLGAPTHKSPSSMMGTRHQAGYDVETVMTPVLSSTAGLEKENCAVDLGLFDRSFDTAKNEKG